MKKLFLKLLALVLVSAFLMATMPVGALAFVGTAEAVEQDEPSKGSYSSTTYEAMLARAEAIVNYTWTPSQDIATWNGNRYNGLTYFPAGSTVVGEPYTLFTSEVVSWSLCSLEQYTTKAGSNYSATAYCNSVSATRTGPVYGSCCADLVCEVFGGNFMNGDNPRYHNVAAIRNSSYGTTIHDQKMSDIKAGDALSDAPNHYHIIWVGNVTDTEITIYEQTPPVARKVVLNKAEHTDANGYFVYGDKQYSVITRSNSFVSSGVTPSSISSRIDALFELIGNQYFTVNHSACGTHESGHSCSNCYNESVIQQSWFISKFGTISSASLFPKTYTSSSYLYPRGWSCAGFAAFAEWWLFAGSNTESVTTEKIGTYNFNYSNMSTYGRAGDLLRLNNSHSVILISVDSSNGIYVLDCNYGYSTYGQCYVRKHYIPFSAYSTVTISRSTNSVPPDPTPTPIPNLDYQIGNYKINVSQGVNLRSGPSTGYSVLTAIPNGTTVYVSEISSNWGKTSYNGNAGWICLDYCLFLGNPGPNPIVDTSYPTPFNCRYVGTSNAAVYSSPGGSQDGYIFPGDNCVIEEVYCGPEGYNGWCKVTYPTSSGSKTRYVGIEQFVHYPKVSIYQMNPPRYTTTYYNYDAAESATYTDSSETIYVLSVYNNMVQIVYPSGTSTGKFCAWVYASDLIPDAPTVYTNKTEYLVGETATVSWNAVPGNKYYWTNVYRNGDLILDFAPGSETSYNLTDLQPGTYWINLSANNDFGGNGSSCQFTVVSPAPAAPQNVRTDKTLYHAWDTVNIYWDASYGADNYRFYVYKNDVELFWTDLGNVQSYSYYVESGGWYTIYVRASTNGSFSEASSTTFRAYEGAPAAPTNLRTSTGATTFYSTDSIVFYWDAVDTAEAYSVQIWSNGELLYDTGLGSFSDLSYVSSPMYPGSYTIAVRSANWFDYSSTSATLDFTVVAPEHTCDMGEYVFYQAVHPHYNCYRCSICGQIWVDYNSSNFVDSCAECHRPDKPIVVAYNGNNWSPTLIEWTDCGQDTNYYELFIYDYSTGICVESVWNITDTHCLVDLAPGEYYCTVSACNSDHDIYTMSDQTTPFCVIPYISAINLAAVTEYNGHTYAVLSGMLTVDWHSAEQLCETLGGHLVTITSQEEMDIVYSLAQSASDYAMLWIGASDEAEEGVWTWVTGESFSYSNWADGEPNSCNGYDEDYAHFYTNSGEWNDTRDISFIGILLELDYTADSFDSTILNTVEWNGHTYTLFANSVTSWLDAEAICESMGGTLVTINSSDEQFLVEGLTDGLNISTVFIGASDTASEGVWTWITGEPVTYSNWYTNEPNGGANENYAMMLLHNDNHGKWIDHYSLSQIGYFIMEKVVTHTVTFKDWDGTILKTETVEHGADATPPSNPSRDGYTFTGWSGSYTNVTSDREIVAQYEELPTVTPTPEPIPEDAPKIIVESEKNAVLAGDSFIVKIKIENNPGIIALKLHLSYSDALTLTAINDTGLLNGMVTGNINDVLVWYDSTASSNNYNNGVIVELTFTVAPDAEAGTYPICASYNNDYDEIFDVDYNNVEFAVINGFVNIVDVIIGDVNSDGKVTMKDGVFLGRYLAEWEGYDDTTVNLIAADVNNDQKVTMKDAVVLGRHFAEWAGYENLPYTTKTHTYSKNNPVSCENTPRIVVGSVSGNPGDTVVVEISIEDNPGIIALKLHLSYSDYLTLTAVEDTHLLNGMVAGSITNALVWYDSTAIENNESNGVIARLTFTISANAEPGEYPVCVSYDNSYDEIFDVNYDNVEFEIVNGAVIVEGEKYTVTYTINGEVFTTQSYDFGAPVIAPEYDVPEGYTFSGWIVPETMPAEDITLDATLEPIQLGYSFEMPTASWRYHPTDDSKGDIRFVAVVNFDSLDISEINEIGFYMTLQGYGEQKVNCGTRFFNVTETSMIYVLYVNNVPIQNAAIMNKTITVIPYFVRNNHESVAGNEATFNSIIVYVGDENVD